MRKTQCYWARRTFALWLQWQVSTMHAPAYTDTHLYIIVPSLCWMPASMVTHWCCASPHSTLLEKIVPSPALLLHAFISSCRITNGLPCLVGGFCSSRFPYNLFQRTVVDFPNPTAFCNVLFVLFISFEKIADKEVNELRMWPLSSG